VRRSVSVDSKRLTGDVKFFAAYDFRGLHKNGAIEGGVGVESSATRGQCSRLITDERGSTRTWEMSVPGIRRGLPMGRVGALSGRRESGAKCCCDITPSYSTEVSECQ